MLTTKKARVIAGIICLTYVFVQIFQTYVLKNLPETHSSAEVLLQGAERSNLWRAGLLLLSFFGMTYVFMVICIHNLRSSFMPSLFALFGFVAFCSLEICLRAIELFYVQTELPVLFQQLQNPDEQKRILNTFSSFQSVQYSLYFPLLFSQMLASIVLSFAFNRNPRVNYLIIVALGINAIRLVGRILGMFIRVNWIGSLSDNLYLPFVVGVFGLIALWLLAAKEDTPREKLEDGT